MANTVPTDPMTMHPAVDQVEARLRAFAGDVDRVQAAELLSFYQHADALLSGEERLLVLRRFPVPGDRLLPPTVEGFGIGGRQ